MINSTLNKKHILLVEDDQNLADRLQHYLNTTYQAQAVVADNLNKARIALKMQKPHLVILDRQLRQDDGIELLQHIRQNPELEDTIVVMLTGKDSEEDKELAHQHRADAYFTKPFILRDIIRQIEAILRRALIKTNQESDENKLVLAGNIAHEMRNPLNKFSLLADLIQEKHAKKQLNDQEVEEIAKLMKATAKDAKIFIELILSDISNKKIDKANFHPLSIAQAIQQALELYPFRKNEQNIVKLHIEQDFNIIGSNTLLHYVLFNLLKNALYYFASHPDMTINIGIKSTNERGYLLFEDTARGIAPNQLENIFSTFTSGKKGGTGLGLSFCKRVIESFEGTISCSSTLGEYTLFTMTFPITDQTLTKKTPETKASDLHFNNKSILLIEDEAIHSMLIKSLLEDIKGIRLYFAEDGKAALEQIKTVQPDLILTDLNIPYLSGKELIEAIKKLKLKKQPILISLSATDPKPDTRNQLNDVLVKPVSKRDLIAKLNQYLS